MTDLTKNEKPFGLLDEATQKALRECGGEVEIYGPNGWEECDPAWWPNVVYRQKPQPPKPRDFWVELDTSGRAVAVHEFNHAFIHPTAHPIIHVREVMPE